MKKAVVAASLILLLAPAWAQGIKPDFSGKWNLDIAKSDFGQSPPPDYIVHVIEHKEPHIKITTTQKGSQGESTTERNLTTDGKDNVNKMRMMGGEQELKSTSKWEGSKLATAIRMDVQGAPVELHDTWELSDGGKVLTIIRAAKTPQGAFTLKTVYNLVAA